MIYVRHGLKSGRVFTEGMGVLPRYLMNYRCCEIGVKTFPIALKIDSSAELPVEFQSDRYDHYKIQTRSFETTRDLVVRRLIA